MYNNLAAMNAFSDGMSTSAHNIANISTQNYSSLQYNYDSGPAGQVELQIDPTLSPIPATNDPAPSLAEQSSVLNVPLNNDVDLAREFTQQISTQTSFEANAIAIATRDEMQRDLYSQVNGDSLVSYKV